MLLKEKKEAYASRRPVVSRRSSESDISGVLTSVNTPTISPPISIPTPTTPPKSPPHPDRRMLMLSRRHSIDGGYIRVAQSGRMTISPPRPPIRRRQSIAASDLPKMQGQNVQKAPTRTSSVITETTAGMESATIDSCDDTANTQAATEIPFPPRPPLEVDVSLGDMSTPSLTRNWKRTQRKMSIGSIIGPVSASSTRSSTLDLSRRNSATDQKEEEEENKRNAVKVEEFAAVRLPSLDSLQLSAPDTDSSQSLPPPPPSL